MKKKKASPKNIFLQSVRLIELGPDDFLFVRIPKNVSVADFFETLRYVFKDKADRIFAHQDELEMAIVRLVETIDTPTDVAN